MDARWCLTTPLLAREPRNGSFFSGATAAIGGFCLHPATTFSTTEETLYIPTHISSAGATYRLHTITGTPGAPVFNVDPANRTRPGGGWTQPGGDALAATVHSRSRRPDANLSSDHSAD